MSSIERPCLVAQLSIGRSVVARDMDFAIIVNRKYSNVVSGVQQANTANGQIRFGFAVSRHKEAI